MLATSKPVARGAGVGNGKYGKTHAVRAEAVTLKKVEQRNRTYCVQLQNRCRLFDLERGASNASFRTKKRSFKKRIEDYEKRLAELRDLKLDTSTNTFVTESKEPETEESLRRQVAGGVMLDLDAVGSIRRQTRPTNGGLVIGRALLSLQRLQRKHLEEYEEAVSSLTRLEREVGVSIDAKLPRRSYSPPGSPSTPVKSSAFLLYQQGQIRAKEKELRQLGLRNSARARPKTAPSAQPPQSARDRPGGGAAADATGNLVHLFCKRVATAKAKESATAGAAVAAAGKAPADGADQKTAGYAARLKKSLNGKNIALLSYHHYAEIVTNPFDNGVIPEVTRSRLLIQAQKDERMYVWLGFESHDEMMKALHSKDGKIKQIPAALLHILEDAAQDDTAEALDNLVESESEASSDGEDARFKIFDDNKVLGKKLKVKAKHTV